MSEQGLLLDVDPTARHDEDFYRTPAWMIRALLRRCPIPMNLTGRVVEPCVGDGAILRELPEYADVLTNDLVVREPMLPEFLLDARLPATWLAFAASGALDIVLTNPPFDVTWEIAQQAIPAARYGVVLLQRITWIEPTIDRGPWLKEFAPTRVIVMPRWNFRSRNGKGGTDSAPPAWFLWAREPWFCSPGVEVVTTDERDELIAMRVR